MKMIGVPRVFASLCGMAVITIGFGQSAFQDARGESSLFLPGTGGFFQLNTKAGTGRIAYLRNISNQPWFYGIQVDSKLTGDSANLFKDSSLSQNTSISLTIGMRRVLSKTYDLAMARFKQEFDLDRPDLSDSYVPARLASIENQVRFLLAWGPDPLPATFYLKAKIKDGKPVRDDDGKIVRDEHGVLMIDVDAVTAYINDPKNYGNIPNVIETRNSGVLRAAETDWFSISAGINRSKFNIYDPTKPTGSQVFKEDFSGYSLGFNYNYFRQNTLLGLSVGLQRGNNVDDLDQVDVLNQTVIGVGQIVQGTTKAWQGPFKRVDRVPAKFDMIIWPTAGGQFGVDFFGRVDLRDTKGFTPGVSFFVTKKGSPLEVIGGLSFTFKNGVQTALVAGFSF